MHHLIVDPKIKPMKQKLCKMHPKVALLIKVELQKMLEEKFIWPIDYPEWVSNIFPIGKASRGILIYLEFWDLNLAFPKDDFPLPNIDIIVDLTAKHETLSLMDGFSSYNKIKIVEEDQHKMTFTTPWGTFYYQVMPFGLKNASATYQHVMTTIFHDLLHVIMEDYVDDLLGKSKTRESHNVA